MRRTFLLVLALTTLAALLPARANAADGPLVTAVHAEKLAAFLHSQHCTLGDPLAVSYGMDGMTLTLRVYPSVQAAREAFAAKRIAFPAAPRTDPKIGDDYYSWRWNDAARFALRRSNVVLEVFGEADRVIQSAPKIDEALVANEQIAPKGDAVRPPNVEFVPDGQIMTGEMAYLKFKSLDGRPVSADGWDVPHFKRWGNSGPISPRPAVEGRAVFHLRPGQRTIVATVATTDNIVTQFVIPIHPISRQEYEAKQAVWSIPDIMHPALTWGIRKIYLVDHPERAPQASLGHESLLVIPHESAWSPLFYDEEYDAAVTEARKQWGAVLNPDLMPHSVRGARKKGEASFQIYNLYTVKHQANIFLRYSPAECEMYLEQPDPLPQDYTPLDFDSILKSSDAKVTKETYTRYRSFGANGPYTKVKVWRLRWTNP